MSIECGECERDARGGHGDDCTIGLKREIEQLKKENQELKDALIIVSNASNNWKMSVYDDDNIKLAEKVIGLANSV